MWLQAGKSLHIPCAKVLLFREYPKASQSLGKGQRQGLNNAGPHRSASNITNSTFASRQLPAVKYIISRSKVIAHPHQFTLPPPHTVLKVPARVEKSVPHYRGDYEFSILGGGTFTFKTVSPEPQDTGLANVIKLP